MGMVQGYRIPADLFRAPDHRPVPLRLDDPFINSLVFSVMLHIGTLLALLVFFWRDWLRLSRPASRRSASAPSGATQIAGSRG